MKLEQKVNGVGKFRVDLSQDPDYPGIDVEFITEDTSAWNKNMCHPRVLFEYVKEEGVLRALIWGDPDDEDYDEEIVFDLDKFLRKKRAS